MKGEIRPSEASDSGKFCVPANLNSGNLDCF